MSIKPLLVFIAPVQSRSGYGEHARDILRALIQIDKYDLKVVPIRWGSTPLNALKKGIDDDISNLIMPTPQLPRKPEVSIQLTVPNEFNPTVAQYNIGITAGIETTICSHQWTEGLNRMNMNIVPSEFSKQIFMNTVFTQKDPQGNVISSLKCEKPVHVVFEGTDTSIFHKTENIPAEIRRKLNEISEDFLFLFVGHWLQGGLGADRKDVGMLIKVFLETFKGKINKPALLLKTGSTFSKMDEADILNKVNTIKNSVGGDIPNIYIIHGELTADEMNSLYNHSKVKTHISFTKGEGFGRPLLEASLSEKPIIVSGWSGHIDFLPKERAILLPGKLEQVHPSAVWAGIIEPSAQWFNVNYSYASNIMLDVWKRYQNYLPNAKALGAENRIKFSFNKMKEILEKLLDENIPQFSVPQPIALPSIPKLKKINKEKINEVREQIHEENSGSEEVSQSAAGSVA